MNDSTGKDLPTWIAEELGTDCSRLSLETESDYYDLFEALVRNVGLSNKNDDNGFVEQSIENNKRSSKEEEDHDLDYYCRDYMGVIVGDKKFNNRLTDCIKSFDDKFVRKNWRRFGLPGRRITERRAEIFICCSAHSYGRSLKQHLAEFFSHCRHREKIRLTCAERQGRLKAEAVSPR